MNVICMVRLCSRFTELILHYGTNKLESTVGMHLARNTSSLADILSVPLYVELV